ncbi:MAG: SBBP repeat-containing protein, partial [Armatimonadetes bacterium]|nr:SBBP repeat-containing protein [Armatimonadota bacterium]
MKSFVNALCICICAAIGAPASAQTEQWAARYNGPANGYDVAREVAVDAEGNVYVTGSSLGSGTGRDYATVKYDSAGNEQWVARYNGPANSDDFARDIALDVSGNVYVTGTSPGVGSSNDYATIKYDAAGNEQWVARYIGPGINNQDDTASGLALDASGNAYVTGTSWAKGSGPDYATVKYDAAGNEQWVARYNGPGNLGDYTSDIEVDSSGNVYVTGSAFVSPYGGQGHNDYATVKYDAAGNEQWVALYNGLGGYLEGYEYAYALALDASGNVYVTGRSWNGNNGSYDYATVKYDSAGNEQWDARYHSPWGGEDWAYALGVDASGNVYVTGFSWNGNNSSYDYATVKYDSAGNQQWVVRYNGPGNGEEIARALAVDASGNVYVTGTSLGAGSGYDYATVKYDSAGKEQWVVRYNGPGNNDDNARALAVDVSG